MCVIYIYMCVYVYIIYLFFTFGGRSRGVAYQLWIKTIYIMLHFRLSSARKKRGGRKQQDSITYVRYGKQCNYSEKNLRRVTSS